jgi:hypothetical protein
MVQCEGHLSAHEETGAVADDLAPALRGLGRGPARAAFCRDRRDTQKRNDAQNAAADTVRARLQTAAPTLSLRNFVEPRQICRAEATDSRRDAAPGEPRDRAHRRLAQPATPGFPRRSSGATVTATSPECPSETAILALVICPETRQTRHIFGGMQIGNV